MYQTRVQASEGIAIQKGLKRNNKGTAPHAERNRSFIIQLLVAVDAGIHIK
jgi:hypothetical protein